MPVPCEMRRDSSQCRYRNGWRTNSTVQLRNRIDTESTQKTTEALGPNPTPLSTVISMAQPQTYYNHHFRAHEQKYINEQKTLIT